MLPDKQTEENKIMSNNLLSVLNPNDIAFYDKVYHVEIGYYYSISTVVYADCEQDALDVLIDSLDKELTPGYFLNESDTEEAELGEFISGGNNGAYLSFTNDEMRITEVNCSEVYVIV